LLVILVTDKSVNYYAFFDCIILFHFRLQLFDNLLMTAFIVVLLFKWHVCILLSIYFHMSYMCVLDSNYWLSWLCYHFIFFRFVELGSCQDLYFFFNNELFWLVIYAGLFRSDSTSVVGGMLRFFNEFVLDFLFFNHPCQFIAVRGINKQLFRNQSLAYFHH